MKSKFFSLFALMALFIWGISPAQALMINVSNSTEFQDALDMALTSNEDDTIILAAGQYDTPGMEFEAVGLGDFGLTLQGAGAGMTILDGQLNNRVLNLASDMGNIRIENMTIQRGRSGTNTGGGLLVLTTTGTVTIDGVDFINNQNDTGEDGGAADLAVGDTDITITNSTFTDNVSGAGGALRLQVNNGSILVEENQFTNNMAMDSVGGGIFAAIFGMGPITINNNTFSQHTADNNGGALSLETGTGDITLEGNSFDQNTATTQDGGAVWADASNGTILFNNNTVQNSSSGSQGGGVFLGVNTGDINITNNTFTNSNDAVADGGAIHFRGGSASNANVINNIIADSEAQSSGGGIFMEIGGTLNMINNTITGNTAGSNGGGARLILDSSNAVFNIYNNIVWNNTAPAMNGMDILVTDNSSGEVNLFNNDFTEFCFEGVSCDPMDLGPNQGSNLIDQDPLFLDVAAFNFHLGPGSPVIDAGTSMAPALPATDHDGNPRIFGAEPDMGALEAIPMIMADPLMTDFGQIMIGENASSEVTLSNPGSIDLDITNMNLVDGDQYTLDVNGGANPCGSLTFTLASGASCTITVTFAPNAEGVANATLNIESTDPTVPSLQVTFTGIGFGIVPIPVNFSGGGCALGASSMAGSWAGLIFIGLTLGILRVRKTR